MSEKIKKHANIPIFIPHLGCPNTCVFCNQRTISGVEKFDVASVKEQIDAALETVGDDRECEIAFFGGSFTGIDTDLMISLLEIAHGYIKEGRVASVRCSTRPDYIDENILSILKRYGVKTVELGLQSVSEDVLIRTKRGHTREDERRAAELIVKNGFDFVGQMMIGLPGSDIENELETADFIISSGAKCARIYPTVVFRGTELCEMAKRGEYVPITNEEAAERAALVYERFFNAGVKVIRIGLQATEALCDEGKFYAGASHSAMGELVLGEFYYRRIKDALADKTVPPHSSPVVFVPRGSVSRAVGQKKKNKLRLIEEFSFADVHFKEDANLAEGEIAVSFIGERDNKCT